MSLIDKIYGGLINKVDGVKGNNLTRRDALSLRYKHEFKGKPQTDNVDDDTIEVSVAALCNFLSSMLYGELPNNIIPSNNNHNSNNIAIKAYNCTARMVHDKNIEDSEEKFLSRKNSYISSENVAELGVDTREKIERFIQDLKELESKGRYVLILTKNKSLVDSIGAAIIRAQQDIL